jgi:hypothetical protein
LIEPAFRGLFLLSESFLILAGEKTHCFALRGIQRRQVIDMQAILSSQAGVGHGQHWQRFDCEMQSPRR